MSDEKKIESEKRYRRKLIEGFTKSPELLSRIIARLFWRVGQPDHLICVEQFITDVNILAGDNIMCLCDDIAKVILENVKDVSNADDTDS